MTYRKFSADFLFDGYSMIAGDQVLVAHPSGLIEGVFPVADAGQDIEVLEGVLCPGFVNCHCHLELSHMKGLIPEKTGLVDFLLAVIRQRNHEPEIILERIAAAESEMLLQGIVAVGDICNTSYTLNQKNKSRLLYHNFIEAIGFSGKSAPDRFEDARKVHSIFTGDPFIGSQSVSIVPHAPYSVSGELFGLICSWPGNQLLSIHNQESPAENELYKNGSGDLNRLYQSLGIDASGFLPTGKNSLPSYLPYFQKNQSLILVHDVASGKSDIEFCKEFSPVLPQLYFCLCPGANQYISGSVPPIPLLYNSGFPIVIGTDSLASNQQLSILEELKILQHHFPFLTLEALLTWGTSNGARALKMEKQTGSFEKGKKPGVIVIDKTAGQKLSAASGVKRVL